MKREAPQPQVSAPSRFVSLGTMSLYFCSSSSAAFLMSFTSSSGESSLIWLTIKSGWLAAIMSLLSLWLILVLNRCQSQSGVGHFALIASLRIRPMQLLGISILSSVARVGAMSAGLTSEWCVPGAIPAP
jgi:hypothetical protein